MFLLFLGVDPLLVVADPEILRDMFVNHGDDYHKSTESEKAGFRPLLGHGILMSEGPLWKRQRAALVPVFHYRCLQMMVPLMSQSAFKAIREWKEQLSAQISTSANSPGGGYLEVDWHPAISRITLDIVMSSMLGSTAHIAVSGEVYTAFTRALSQIDDPIYQVLARVPLINRLPLASFRAVEKSCRYIHDLADRVISDRRHGLTKASITGAYLQTSCVPYIQHATIVREWVADFIRLCDLTVCSFPRW